MDRHGLGGLGTGKNRRTFVGTLAMKALKLTVFGATDLVDGELFVLAAGIGLFTIPGNQAGRWLLKRIKVSDLRTIIDVLTALMIVNFSNLATR